MADRTLAQITAAATLTGEELVHVVQGSNSRRATVADLAAYAESAAMLQKYSLPYKGALAKLTSDRASQDFTAVTTLVWDGVEYQSEAIWSAGSPTRLVVPVGWTKVRLIVGCAFSLHAATSGIYLDIVKNGATFVGHPAHRHGNADVAVSNLSAETPVIPVTGGTDYFEARAQVTGDTSITWAASQSYFAMQCIETTDARGSGGSVQGI